MTSNNFHFSNSELFPYVLSTKPEVLSPSKIISLGELTIFFIGRAVFPTHSHNISEKGISPLPTFNKFIAVYRAYNCVVGTRKVTHNSRYQIN